MNSSRAQEVLPQLTEKTIERNHELQTYSSIRQNESDDDANSLSSIFDSFYNSGGNTAKIKIINFTPIEYRKIYSALEETIKSYWNVGRRRKYNQSPTDVLFMTLVMYKHGGSWDFLGNMFRIKGPTSMQLKGGFMEKIVEKYVNKFVNKHTSSGSMHCLIDKYACSNNHSYALEAVNVTFQQTNRPSGNMQDGKIYFSCKHKLYGYKFEVCVMLTGTGTAASMHYSGSLGDFTIFTKRHHAHKGRLAQINEDDQYVDEYMLSDKHPDQWAVLADKSYHGIQELSRVITQFKKPNNGVSSQGEKEFNRKVSACRIIVENCFRRMGKLWLLLSVKYKWRDELYDMVFALGVAFTSVHLGLQPLRADDIEWCNRCSNRLNALGEHGKRKRNEEHEKYRQNRKQHLPIGYRASEFDSEMRCEFTLCYTYATCTSEMSVSRGLERLFLVYKLQTCLEKGTVPILISKYIMV